MGEYVWTTFTIGGKMTRETAEDLHDLGNSFSEQDNGSPWEPEDDAKTVTYAGEVNYGNLDDMEAECQSAGVPYTLSWSGAAGVFSAGVKCWHPGMESADEMSADDDGEPLATALEIKTAHEAGKIPELIERMRRFVNLPPIEIIETVEG